MPGTSGILSPFAQMNGSYFDPKDEPDEFMFEFIEACKQKLDEDGCESIHIAFNSDDDYYAIMKNAKEFAKNNFKVFGVGRDDPEIIIQKEDATIAEHELPKEDA